MKTNFEIKTHRFLVESRKKFEAIWATFESIIPQKKLKKKKSGFNLMFRVVLERCNLKGGGFCEW